MRMHILYLEGESMIKSIKIRLKPNKEQEVLMFKSAGISRFTYNWALARWNEIYKNGEKPNKVKIRKEFNYLKKDKEYEWLKEVSAQVSQYAFEDLQTAYKNFFEGKAKKPQFKSKKRSKTCFYARYDALKFQEDTVKIEKIGKVKYYSDYGIPNQPKYNNPRISYDGKYWYLSFGFEHEIIRPTLTNESIGIDVGIIALAICSNLDKPIKNINKSTKVRRLKKKLKRLQRQVSRKYEMNKQGQKFIKTKNIIKLEKKIKLVHRKLRNIRLNHIHQATNVIVKTKPSRVVMETLNITGMMKNKHLAKAIQEQKLYEFKRQLQYKCKFNGIEFVEADRFYPSSKMCSCCESIKKDLKLSERVYHCTKCGYKEDRDKNASINLAKYKLVV
jgi:putative transposase